MIDPAACPCGCVNVMDPSGLWRRVSTCPGHTAMQRDLATLDEAYYRENGALDADAPQRYVGELREALGELPRAPHPLALALEIGGGVSPYVTAIKAAGWLYLGIDPSPWPAEWSTARHGTVGNVFRVGTIEDTPEDYQCDFLIAAHVLEHLADAPGAVAKCARLLAPGGELWIVVPDDQDPCNPDHLWTGNADAWRGVVEAAGLAVERLAVRRYIEREQFVYLRARKA